MKPSDMNQEPATAAPAGWREFLARTEWSGEMYDRFGDHACICPDCGGQQAVGHGPGCELAAMLAAAPAPVAPIDMVLHCPACGLQHVDAPWQPGAALTNEQIVGTEPVWDNPPHRSHLCHGCGHRWRPADVPTNGVAAVKTKGKADSPPVAPAPVARPLTPMQAVLLWGHRSDGPSTAEIVSFASAIERACADAWGVKLSKEGGAA